MTHSDFKPFVKQYHPNSYIILALVEKWRFFKSYLLSPHFARHLLRILLWLSLSNTSRVLLCNLTEQSKERKRKRKGRPEVFTFSWENTRYKSITTKKSFGYVERLYNPRVLTVILCSFTWENIRPVDCKILYTRSAWYLCSVMFLLEGCESVNRMRSQWDYFRMKYRSRQYYESKVLHNTEVT